MSKKKKPKTAGLFMERQFVNSGKTAIVGLDEAGRGAWAGPVYVGAVCLPFPRMAEAELTEALLGVRDSKFMSARQRTILAERIQATAVAWGVGFATHQEIDEKGINPATALAVQRAMENLRGQFTEFEADLILMDGLRWRESPYPKELLQSIKQGGQQSLTIAAASVLAKVARDAYMCELDQQYPDYRFSAHKGYGTLSHRTAIQTHGVLEIHRRYYKPIRALLVANE